MAKTSTKPDHDVILKKLGDTIVRLRKTLGKSQNDLAYEIGWDKPNLRKIEKGKTNPTVKTLHKLAIALKVSIPQLFEDVS